MNDQIQREMGIDRPVYEVDDVADDIHDETTRYAIATDTGDDVETLIACSVEQIPGEPIGLAGAKRMTYDEFLQRQPEGTADVIAESDALGESDFPVCELGQWYVDAAYQNQGIGMQIVVELLSNLGDVAHNPVVGVGLRKSNHSNPHLEQFQQVADSVVGEVRGSVSMAEREDGTAPEFDVVIYKANLNHIRSYLGI
jgi:hypothetical protein